MRNRLEVLTDVLRVYVLQGVDLWGLTIQNESENPGPWEACVYSPSSQVKQRKRDLGKCVLWGREVTAIR